MRVFPMLLTVLGICIGFANIGGWNKIKTKSYDNRNVYCWEVTTFESPRNPSPPLPNGGRIRRCLWRKRNRLFHFDLRPNIFESHRRIPPIWPWCGHILPSQGYGIDLPVQLSSPQKSIHWIKSKQNWSKREGIFLKILLMLSCWK